MRKNLTNGAKILISKIKVLILSSILSFSFAHSESKLYQDSLGLPSGSSYELGNVTIYQNPLNLPAGTSKNLGDTTVYSNSLNLPIGSSRSNGPDPFSALDDPRSPLNYKTKSLYE